MMKHLILLSLFMAFVITTSSSARLWAPKNVIVGKKPEKARYAKKAIERKRRDGMVPIMQYNR